VNGQCNDVTRGDEFGEIHRDLPGRHPTSSRRTFFRCGSRKSGRIPRRAPRVGCADRLVMTVGVAIELKPCLKYIRTRRRVNAFAPVTFSPTNDATMSSQPHAVCIFGPFERTIQPTNTRSGRVEWTTWSPRCRATLATPVFVMTRPAEGDDLVLRVHEGPRGMETSTRAPRGPSAGRATFYSEYGLKWPRLFATTNGRWSNCSVVCSTPCAIWTPRTTSDEPVAYDNMTPASHQRRDSFSLRTNPEPTDRTRLETYTRKRSRSKKSQRNARRGELSCF